MNHAFILGTPVNMVMNTYISIGLTESTWYWLFDQMPGIFVTTEWRMHLCRCHVFNCPVWLYCLGYQCKTSDYAWNRKIGHFNMHCWFSREYKVHRSEDMGFWVCHVWFPMIAGGWPPPHLSLSLIRLLDMIVHGQYHQVKYSQVPIPPLSWPSPVIFFSPFFIDNVVIHDFYFHGLVFFSLSTLPRSCVYFSSGIAVDLIGLWPRCS